MDKLKDLRDFMKKEGLDALLIPRTDEFQGEYIAPCSDRLQWLTGFTGSAGFAVITKDKAGFFTDGRYVLQAREEVPGTFEHFNTAQKTPALWVSENTNPNPKIGYDPKIFTESQLKPYNSQLVPLKANPIDTLWKERPGSPQDFIVDHPLDFAGESGADKRKKIARQLEADQVLITACDSIAWLLNIRGTDVAYNPLVHCVCLLRKDGSYDLFIDLNKIEGDLYHYITEGKGRAIDIGQLETHLKNLKGSCLVDPQTCPVFYIQTFEKSGVSVVRGKDPCVLPKALKNEVEIQGAINAHVQDGIALCRFLAWLDAQPLKGETTELSASKKLLEFRQEGEFFKDLSFESISAYGPHGAIIHYRVTEASDIPLKKDGIYLLDSGGQYLTGTTDVTRTIALGKPTEEQKDRFTRVLKGHIAIASAVFPKGVSGNELDVLARESLWQVGCDYDHGTGHGVGSYLNVHEGPQGISRKASAVPLMPGMIISNEPGYYKEGEYGIRIESLVRVVEHPGSKGYLGFDTLTLAPIDLTLIDGKLLNESEREWLNSYHRQVYDSVSSHLDESTKTWLKASTREID
jgi:Xaa-Pro aminopeptidase